MEYALFPTVGEIAQKNIFLASDEMTVREAARLMHERGVSSVIIERQGARYLFTVEDMLHYAALGRDSDTPLRDILSHKVQCIRYDERVLAALDRLESGSERYLGVTDHEGRLMGVVTYTDILSSIDPSVLVEKKTIGELISRNTPVTFTADWVLEDVLCHLNRLEDAIIVVEGRVPTGIVTTRDLFRLIASGQSTAVTLGSIMTTPVATTSLKASIHEVLLQLKSRNIKRAVVVDEGNEVAGVVTQSQLVGFAYGSWINLIKYHAGELRELVVLLESRAREFEQQALTDPLTGLSNRRVLYSRMAEEMERIRRYNLPGFSVVLIDIDHFKRVNDTYGHLSGDKVLEGVGKALRRSVRLADTVVRWGGEEFAVFMPHTSTDHAILFAERVVQRVASLRFLDLFCVTISAGVGEYGPGEKMEAFMGRVDQALYQAKSLGRNRVVQAGGS